MRMRVILGALLLITASGCGLFGDDGDPQAVADSVATAIEAKSLTDVSFTDAEPDAEFAKVIAGLGESKVEVAASVGDVKENSTTATLSWTWQVNDIEWSYDSKAAMTRVEDEWQVVWSPSLIEPSLVAGEVLEVDTTAPRRGEILAGDGAPIVTNRDVLKLGLDKTKIDKDQITDSATRIAEELDIDVDAYLKRVEAAGPKAFVEALVMRAEEARTGLDPKYEEIPGAVSLGSHLPLGPTSTFAAPLLGTVGPVTAEIVKNSDGRLSAGDTAGLSGLQARYDEQLAGHRGIQVEAVSAKGEERELFSQDPVDGKPLELSLDIDLQRKAEETLADTKSASAIVVLDPETGKILAAASGPGSKGQNTATAARYAPGSTFKVVTALALLRNGLTPKSMVDCPATVVVDGKKFKNYDDYPSSSLGKVTLREVFAQSCNTAFIDARDRLSANDLAEAAAALGLGEDHDLGFPAYFGQVPEASGETEKAADQIGQGKILASPLAMAAVAASVRSGRTVLPQLITGHKVSQTASKQPLTDQEAQQLRSLMRAVVTEGPGNFLASVPGEVEAKTGTAEYGATKNGELPTHAWMLGTTDQRAVAVFVETGQSGSGTAGPLLAKMLR